MSFVDHYPIVTLPRVSDLPLNSRVVIPSVDFPESNQSNIVEDGSIHLGISKSNISHYVVYPTPRLIWSYPISPSSVIECMTVMDDQYFVGVTERKQYKFLNINKSDDSVKETKFKSPVKCIKYGPELTVLLLNGDIVTLDHGLNVVSHVKEVEGYEVVFADIDEKHNDHTIIILKSVKKDEIKYKFGGQSYTTNYEECMYGTFNNFVYKYKVEDHTISKVDVKLNVVNTVDLSSVLTTKESVSIGVSSEDRVIISDNKKMYLINIKYGSKLDEFALDENSNNEIIQINKVKGNTNNSIETKLFYLKLNYKKNKLNLNVLNVNIGLNNLLTSINKGIQKDNSDDIKELNNLIQDDYAPKLDTKVGKLMKLYDSKDLNKFESETLNYLKNRKCKLNYYTFETEDRPVDTKAIEALVTKILKVQQSDDIVTIKLQNSKKNPKYLLNYLISHKLFPQQYSKGLLKFILELQNHKITKNCILLTPNLPISELIGHVVKETNLKVINLILNRLVEFKFEDISAEFKHHLNNGEDMNQLFSHLITLNSQQSFKILKHLIDLNGTARLSPSLVDSLVQYINYKIELVELNSFNLNLIHNKFESVENRLPNYSIEVLDI